MKIEVGDKLKMDGPLSFTGSYRYEVIGRTEKMATIKENDSVFRKRITKIDGCEYIAMSKYSWLTK